MQFSASQPPAGWYPDPAGSGDERYWDGSQWSRVTRPSKGAKRSDDSIELPTPAQPTGKLASWPQRAAALVVDCLVLLMPYLWLIQLLAGDAFLVLNSWTEAVLVALQRREEIPEIPQSVMAQLTTASLIIRSLWVCYRVTFLSLWGATPGKLLLRIRVVLLTAPETTRMPIGRAFIRELSIEAMNYLVIPGLLSYLYPLANPRKQTLHDAMAGTIVVRR